MKENEKTEKKCCGFMWCGMHCRPAFVVTDEKGKIIEKPDRELFDETAKMTDDFAEKTESRKYSDLEEFGREAKEFAEKAGWTVTCNSYLDGTLDEALMSAGELAEFRERLRKGEVRFKYKKVGKPMKINRRTGVVTPAVEGEVVTRTGTLNQEIIDHTIGQVEAAERAHRIPNETVVTYFDLGAENRKTGRAGDWRCFKIDAFEGYVED